MFWFWLPHPLRPIPLALEVGREDEMGHFFFPFSVDFAACLAHTTDHCDSSGACIHMSGLLTICMGSLQGFHSAFNSPQRSESAYQLELCSLTAGLPTGMWLWVDGTGMLLQQEEEFCCSLASSRKCKPWCCLCNIRD